MASIPADTEQLNTAIAQVGDGAASLMRIYIWFTEHLQNGPQLVFQGDVAKGVGVSVNTVRRHSKVLCDCGLLIQTATKPGLVMALPKQANQRSFSRYVYLLAGRSMHPSKAYSAPVKIGRAANLRARLSSLQTGSRETLLLVGALRFKTYGVADAVEVALHAEFDRYRMGGEWFNIDPSALWATLSSRFPETAIDQAEKPLAA